MVEDKSGKLVSLKGNGQQTSTPFSLLVFSGDNKRAVRDLLSCPRKLKVAAVISELVFSLVMSILPTSQREMLTESLMINLEFLLKYNCEGAAQGVTCPKKYFVWPMIGVLWLRLSTHLVLDSGFSMLGTQERSRREV